MSWFHIAKSSIKAVTSRSFQFQFSSFAASKPRVCIIGSGPAGFYTAQHILKNHKTACVDIFEKLPVPFGLVRYGVAPDHPEIKNATNSFEEVVRDERCRFYGNIHVGHDLKAAELRQLYHAVVFAYGADDDKRLNIPGEDSAGVYAARSFVGWYNGLPAHVDLEPILDCETAVIIGQGNVALDIARMLLAPYKLLKHTDICDHALNALQKSRIQNIQIIGRRSPLEVAFTIKELREMIRLPNTRPILCREDFVDVRAKIPDIPRQRRRLIDLMCKTALDQPTAEEQERLKIADRQWGLQFLKSPHEIITENNNVVGIQLEQTLLKVNSDGNLSAVGTGQLERISCGMVLRSIGYKSISVEDGIPFDAKLGIIPNISGRVVEEPASKTVVKGLYCSGWVKHGPVGVIATTMNEAFATAQKIVEDLNSGDLQTSTKFNANIEYIMKGKGIKFVTFEDYEKIDSEEMLRGKVGQKPREKITSSNEMLNIAHSDK